MLLTPNPIPNFKKDFKPFFIYKADSNYSLCLMLILFSISKKLFPNNGRPK